MRNPLSIRDYNPQWGSHMAVLTKMMNRTTGPVLELGMGIYSSPLLHWLCRDQNRKLYSYEDNGAWYNVHKRTFANRFHRVHRIRNWDNIDIEGTKWGLVFIDHVASRRAVDAIRAADCAQAVILHDSNGRNEPHYHYSTVYPHFGQRYNYTKSHPHTTVLSNFLDLSTL